MAAAATAGAIALARLPGGLVLAVEDAAGGRVVHGEAVEPGARFVLSYVHSSEHVPVRGTFLVEADRTLTVAETAFAGFGPGLPEVRPGDAWWIQDGMIVHAGAGERLAELTVRVVPLTRHRLRLPSGVELDLSASMGAGGPVRISVRSAPLLAPHW